MKIASPFAAPEIRHERKHKRDTDHDRAEKAYVRARDNGCVAARAAGLSASDLPCHGPIDVDHVRASGGLGMKSPTERDNLVCLCRWHHEAKTQHGKVWRPLLLRYLERVER